MHRAKETENTANTIQKEIHLGNHIKEVLQSERRSIAWFAEQMHCDRSNMYRILSRNHLDSDFLFRASQVLGHDLFLFASEQMSESI